MIAIACICGGAVEVGLVAGLIALCTCIFRKIFKRRKP